MKNTHTLFSLQYIIAIISICILVGIDQFTKYLAIVHLKNNKPYVILENIFELYYLENTGAAFGIGKNKQLFFLLLGVIILIALVYYFIKIPLSKKMLPMKILTSILAAGALGNMIDRMCRNYVVDFFYFKWIDFPIFNMADIYVTVSIILIAVLGLFYYTEDDLFPKNK